ncbi:dihydrodipicolinate synthase family protein [Acuticoccus mangrovi]|uniref:Dihydrodipicolinate synthase family protein n=1 Tax=Acuticoccus mangrovi TaxID=2796142 RepID=A0A934ITI1_9HYPH|nr:dihydrodipicolinate synthase family protein [Acuticoccus mangrovi]MBJ3777907.1 dihydrodipicolinate synthase family protein [Acuticoccus mangrovi]
MYQGVVDTALLRRSVIAVPPLCLNAELRPAPAEMKRLHDHLTAGGVTSILYGGNAAFYHVGVADYGAILDAIEESAPADAWMIPSIGPDFGRMMDQAAILSTRAFPTAMVLPVARPFPFTEDGVVDGIRRAAARFGRPLTVYLKNEAALCPASVAALLREGTAAAIKYAIDRPDPADDAFLDALLDAVGSADRIVSGMGERPVIAQWGKGLRGFTSGSVSIAPALSTAFKAALEAGRPDEADAIWQRLRPLEDLRDEISQIRVLHEAVDQAGIAATGPMLPLLSRLGAADAARVRDVAKALLSANHPTAQAAE